MSENKTAPNAQPQQQGDIFNQPQPTAQPQATPNVAQPAPTALATKQNYGIANLKEQLNVPATIQSFRNLLGEKGANRFMSALINIVGGSETLKKADTTSIILAAGQSAALNLPLNPSLGFAAVVPYWDKKKKMYVAQFQPERNGLVELCQRSGKIKNLVNEIVYEGELVKADRFHDEYDFSGTRTSNKVIGYMAYAKLTNGFEKTIFWDVQKVMAHAQRYSDNYRNKKGKWVEDFNSMALKTVLKHLIQKYLPKTEELELALASDQAVFTHGEIGNAQPEYIDNNQRAERVEAIEVVEVDVDNVEAEEVK